MGMTPFFLDNDREKKKLHYQTKVNRMFGKNNHTLPEKTTEKIK